MVDAAILSHQDPAAFAYNPGQVRDANGRWAAVGSAGAATPRQHAAGRQYAADAVRDFVRRGGSATPGELSTLALHLGRLTVQQLHEVKSQHGLKASAPNKTALVAK